jgi:hypothetical protein
MKRLPTQVTIVEEFGNALEIIPGLATTANRSKSGHFQKNRPIKRVKIPYFDLPLFLCYGREEREAWGQLSHAWLKKIQRYVPDK